LLCGPDMAVTGPGLCRFCGQGWLAGRVKRPAGPVPGR
jgi:hypothetical protein